MDSSLEVNGSILCSKWDLSTQTPHGGQEWRGMKNFIEDFSVTTNPLGTPEIALKAALDVASTIHHYPAADFEPAWSSMAEYISKDRSFAVATVTNGTHKKSLLDDLKSRLLLGNGASELIDLCIRCCPGSTWRPGPFRTQYKEYERAAESNGKKALEWDDSAADILCMVNPCNPTGDFWTAEEVKRYIEQTCKDNSTVLLDESMIPFLGPNWRSESIVSQEAWMEDMHQRRGIHIFVVHSWTKIWSCPGLRIGTLVTPNADYAKQIRRRQVPWSLNSFAIAFLASVTQDEEYMRQTWEFIPAWRKAMHTAISACHPHWKIHGVEWMSFLWIETPSKEEAEYYVTLCKERGVPIRWGSNGYNLPSFIRLGVRNPESVDVLMNALQQPFLI
ncbi:aminotransferase, class I/II superfamily protein [Cardiosporidium cionae]|uniref:Aminotransferase, class I/II superfamily protein n=1 Tax=Cardiosporidium cionae TaxID=476202 RepID=A0ABQ7JCM5_9APIC|nr:aminotransferase, class I/II superfamily protein [Cardiosporidium cionae]|eukprot:KAF8821750.1 aminotransferase, class I/II superfamily protein [Cardiosporidium cionae]